MFSCCYARTITFQYNQNRILNVGGVRHAQTRRSQRGSLASKSSRETGISISFFTQIHLNFK